MKTRLATLSLACVPGLAFANAELLTSRGGLFEPATTNVEQVRFFLFLAATLLVELPVALIYLRSTPRSAAMFSLGVAKLISHPLLYFALLKNLGSFIATIAVVGAALLIEMGVYRFLLEIDLRRAGTLAVSTFMASFVAVGVLMALLGALSAPWIHGLIALMIATQS